MSHSKLEARIDELESKLAFQEDTLQQLNEVIAKQDLSLRTLEHQLKLIADKYRSLQSNQIASEAEETPPPHY
jgi:SlyX protein